MMGAKQGTDIFTARGGIKNQIACIRDWLLLTGIPREQAFTATMKMQELADDALRQVPPEIVSEEDRGLA